MECFLTHYIANSPFGHDNLAMIVAIEDRITTKRTIVKERKGNIWYHLKIGILCHNIFSI